MPMILLELQYVHTYKYLGSSNVPPPPGGIGRKLVAYDVHEGMKKVDIVASSSSSSSSSSLRL